MTREITRRDTLRTLAAASAAATLAMPSGAGAQEALDNLKILVGFPPGGSADIAARWLGDKLAPGHAAKVIVDNKPGAAGRIAIDLLKASPPDGKTMIITPASTLTYYPHVYRKLSYDPMVDLTPVSVASTFVHGFAVGPMVPPEVKNLADYARWAKANPGKSSVGNPGEGSLPHFLTMVLARGLDAPIQAVPYRGGAPGLADMTAGQVAGLMLPDGSFSPFVKDGKARVLATSGTKRSQFFPDVATFAEQGVKDIVVTEWVGMFMPPATPAPIVERAAQALRKALSTPDIAEAYAKAGMLPTPTTPAELAGLIKAETAYWAPIIKSTGFQPLE